MGLELLFDSKTLRVVSSSDNENTKPSTTANPRTKLSGVPPTYVKLIFLFYFKISMHVYIEPNN